MRLLSVSGSPKLNNPHAVIYPQTLLECCGEEKRLYKAIKRALVLKTLFIPL
jgi:hypothetical protein